MCQFKWPLLTLPLLPAASCRLLSPSQGSVWCAAAARSQSCGAACPDVTGTTHPPAGSVWPEDDPSLQSTLVQSLWGFLLARSPVDRICSETSNCTKLITALTYNVTECQKCYILDLHWTIYQLPLQWEICFKKKTKNTCSLKYMKQ